MLKSEYKAIPLGGDSADIPCGHQSVWLDLQKRTDYRRYKRISDGGRHVHPRHLKKANLFHVDGHVSAYGPKDITNETWLTYAIEVNGSNYCAACPLSGPKPFSHFSFFPGRPGRACCAHLSQAARDIISGRKKQRPDNSAGA